MVNPVIVLKTDQSFKTRLKIKYGQFFKKENTLCIWWSILVYFLKKEKLDHRLKF